MWEDHSLSDWGDDDFRIFCGDLGNDVNDELLTRTFNKYPSFVRAKVIRDKRTGKSKGFGFISFKEPADFIRAMKEMDGELNIKKLFSLFLLRFTCGVFNFIQAVPSHLIQIDWAVEMVFSL